jgi:hypothetical protein
VVTTCNLAVESGFVLLPKAGGLDDQDWAWVEVFRMYLAGLRRIKWELENPDVVAAEIEGFNAPSLEDM